MILIISNSTKHCALGRKMLDEHIPTITGRSAYLYVINIMQHFPETAVDLQAKIVWKESSLLGLPLAL